MVVICSFKFDFLSVHIANVNFTVGLTGKVNILSSVNHYTVIEFRWM